MLVGFHQCCRCGSGEVSATLNALLKNDCFFVASDVNIHALAHTRSVLNLRTSDLVRGDLFEAFRSQPLLDVVVFNPPYVPTDDDEFIRALALLDISAAWAGGKDGRVVADRFLSTVVPLLSSRAIVYVVLIELNDVRDFLRLASRVGLLGVVARERKAGIEKLFVLRLRKQDAKS